jgi:signal transduction histidine kinase
LFLANMSHELRTPMHAVLSYAQLGRDAGNIQEQRDYFARIAERGHALLRLLSDLLDLSRLESGSMSMEYAPHDLEALLRDALQQMQPVFRTKGVTSELKRAPDCATARVRVDSVRIGQMLVNVLANAVQFSPEGGRIRVQLSRAALPPGIGGKSPRTAVEIAISDDGVGIPEAELETIFDKFVQSSKTRTNAGGTGLGLSICRQIATLHEGAITASNNSGPGATVRVVLPLAVSILAERGAA